jgi:hypothetical protein
MNDIVISFAVAPANDPNAVGIQRQLIVPVRYVPPSFRDPAQPVITVNDEDFELKP